MALHDSLKAIVAERGYATFLIRDLKCRTVLRPRLPSIVNARRGDVGVPEPFLNLGDIGVMIEGVRRGRGAQRMGSDLEAEQLVRLAG